NTFPKIMVWAHCVPQAPKILEEELCLEGKRLCCKLKKNPQLAKHPENNDVNIGEKVLGEETEKINCKCQDSEVDCTQQVDVSQSFLLEMIPSCSHPHVLCCNIQDDPSRENKTLNEVHEKNVIDMHDDNHVLGPSEQVKNIELNEKTLDLDVIIKYPSLEEESILTDFSLETLHHPEDEINVQSELSMETNLITEEIIADLPKPPIKNSDKSKNYFGKDSVNVVSNTNKFNSDKDIENLYDVYNNNVGNDSSFNDINSRKKTSDKNNKVRNDLLSNYEPLETNNKEHYNLTVHIKKQSSDHCSGDDCIQNEKEENNSLFIIPGINGTTEDISDQTNLSFRNEINLYDLMDELDMFNFTLPMSEQVQNEQVEKNKSLFVISDINKTVEETAGKTNFSFMDDFNLNDMMDDLNVFNFTLTEPEQESSNSAPGALFTSASINNSKSKQIKDQLFYFTYLAVLLYVVSFFIGYLMPIFSVPGLGILQFIAYIFPSIIESKILDIMSPVLRSIYRLFGIL
ncbi:unnamed protein product, partial [Meganyctiphanes norvegica]